jgi:hypothetical protein
MKIANNNNNKGRDKIDIALKTTEKTLASFIVFLHETKEKM